MKVVYAVIAHFHNEDFANGVMEKEMLEMSGHEPTEQELEEILSKIYQDSFMYLTVEKRIRKMMRLVN